MARKLGSPKRRSRRRRSRKRLSPPRRKRRKGHKLGPARRVRRRRFGMKQNEKWKALLKVAEQERKRLKHEQKVLTALTKVVKKRRMTSKKLWESYNKKRRSRRK